MLNYTIFQDDDDFVMLSTWSIIQELQWFKCNELQPDTSNILYGDFQLSGSRIESVRNGREESQAIALVKCIACLHLLERNFSCDAIIRCIVSLP